MLLIQSNSLSVTLDAGERLRLLDALAARGHAPLIRTARRTFFRLLAPKRHGDVAAEELERECAASLTPDEGGAYTPGELFRAGDCLLSLVFDAGGGLTASVIYDAETPGPLGRLDSFCRELRAAAAELPARQASSSSDNAGASSPSNNVEAASSSNDAEESKESKAVDAEESMGAGLTVALPEWRAGAGRSLPQGLARFIAIQPAGAVRAAALRGGRSLRRASELMEEPTVRRFLRRVQELRREGYSPRRLLAEAGALTRVTVGEMVEAGLLEREIRVSCRASGHALFDLPSADSLAAVTISRAKCSLCAAPVADEVVEETLSPTRLAVALLEDGGWLASRVHAIVRSLGVPESEIAAGPASPEGDSCVAADVCGSSFLFVTRDGDLTPAFSRRVAALVEETEAAHAVVVVTGAVEDEGRMRLLEFTWRRARDGRDTATTLVEGLDAAREQIARAFRAAVRRELSRRLFTLDAALGFGAADFVLDWFARARTRAAGAAQAPPIAGARTDARVETGAGL